MANPGPLGLLGFGMTTVLQLLELGVDKIWADVQTALAAARDYYDRFVK